MEQINDIYKNNEHNERRNEMAQYAAKVLLYDIETTPSLGYVWGKWEQNVIEFKSEWEVLSVAHKWLGDRAVQAVGQNTMSEEDIVKHVHSLFEEADVVIAHNGDRFDQKKMNAKFIEFGLNPPAPYKTIDTLKIARKYFAFNSNKLDDLGRVLGAGRKVETGGFSLWKGCIENDPAAWKKMLKYNKQDVQLLEKVYLKLRPWMDNHPALNNMTDRPSACPKCNTEGKMQARGFATTKVAKRRRYQCAGCGGWCQGRHTLKTDVQFVN